jgi:hypothetical protein
LLRSMPTGRLAQFCGAVNPDDFSNGLIRRAVLDRTEARYARTLEVFDRYVFAYTPIPLAPLPTSSKDSPNSTHGHKLPRTLGRSGRS